MATEQHADLDFLNIARILNLPDAASAQQPATFGQLNAAIEGVKAKETVAVAAQGNVDIASPGASIDGVDIATAYNQRVLLPNQTDPAQNGLWVWSGAASPLVRAADANTGPELVQAIVPVHSGTDAGKLYRQLATVVTVGTDAQTWAQFGTSAGLATETVAGIAEIATQAEVDAGTDDNNFITALKLANWSGATAGLSQAIGDGSTLSFDITHGWNTRAVQVEVIRNSGNYDSIDVEIQRPTLNAVRVVFAAGLAPTSNQFLVLVSKV